MANQASNSLRSRGYSSIARHTTGCVNLSQVNNHLAEFYSDYLGFNKENLRQAVEFKYPERPLTTKHIEFSALPRKLLHPIAAYCAGEADFALNTFLCLTHGDLHTGNIFVDVRNNDAWLIDFGRTGTGHWARDFVALEASIKFQHTPAGDLAALFEFEDALTSAEQLDSNIEFYREDQPDLEKAFHCVKHIRGVAASAMSALDPHGAMLDYYTALFYQTLNYVRLHKLISKAGRKNHVLVSAALLLERIQSCRAIAGLS